MSTPKTVARTLAATALAVGLPMALAVPAQAAGSSTSSSLLSVQYRAVGASHIKSIDADLPIARTTLVSTLNTKNLRIVGGTLPIAPQTVSFTAFGVIPLRATTTLTQVGKITGSIKATKKGNVLTTKVSYSIQLSDVEAKVPVLGWTPLAVGNSCKTIDPVVISAASPAKHYFNIFKGGVVAGTYTIGKFQNCAPGGAPDPTGLGTLPVNSLVPGTGNTVNITLSHGRSATTG